MALKLADAVVFLGTDDSGLDQGLASAKKETGGWAKKLGTVTKMAVGGVVVGAAAAAAGALIKVGKEAFDVSSQVRTAASSMAASLGIPKEEAKAFAEVAKRVYGNNFAESVTDAADAVTIVAKQLQLAADDPALQTITENAIALRDTFDMEVGESVDAVKVLMDEFGLSADEAFDLIAAGQQRGLNRSGDFLDTVREYGNQFGDAGFSADEFFSILETGTQGGVLGTDKVADAVKEMQLKLNEGSDETREAFAAMGMDFDKIAGHVRAGDETWADYFPNIISGIEGIEDPIARSQAQVAIFGTQAEDLGVQFTAGLSSTKTSMGDLAGSADMLNQKYDSFGSFFEGMWRRAGVAASPLTDKLLDMANNALPVLEAAFTAFEQKAVPAIAAIANGSGGLFTKISDFVNGELPLIQEIISTFMAIIELIWTNHGTAITTVLQNTWTTIKTIFETTLQLISDILKLGLALLQGDWEGAVEALTELVTNLWDGISTIFQTQLDSLITLVTSFGAGFIEAGKGLMSGFLDGITGAFDNVYDTVKDKVGALRDLLPGSEPKDPSSPLRGLGAAGQALIGNVQKGIDGAQLSLGNAGQALVGQVQADIAGLQFAGAGQAAAATAGPAVNIEIHNHDVTNRDLGEVAFQTESGVVQALRAAGLA